MPWEKGPPHHCGLKSRETLARYRRMERSRDLSGRFGLLCLSNPGHRPTASALGWNLPARWAGGWLDRSAPHHPPHHPLWCRAQEPPGPPRTASAITRDMTIKRLDHVSVVVDDLAAAIAFFPALGMTLEGEAPVEGPWVDRVNGLESVQVDIVIMRTPDGHGRLELTKFRNPKLVEIEPAIAPPNALGLRSVMFTVESVDDTVARLRANGAELVGEVAQYEDKYRLCYMRGPAGIIVALAEELF